MHTSVYRGHLTELALEVLQGKLWVQVVALRLLLFVFQSLVLFSVVGGKVMHTQRAARAEVVASASLCVASMWQRASANCNELQHFTM